MAILAVSGVGSVTTTIRDNGHGVVAVHARNDSASSETTVVLISEGIDFDHAVASVMYHARTMVSETYGVSQNHNNSREKWDSKAITGWKPEWQDECVLPLLNAIEELARNKIQITNLIIDDNWQSLDRIGSDHSQYGWSEFEADRNAFPSGLRSVVAQIRNLHPALQNIIVWHAILGYWGGISPNGLIAKTYSTIKVAQEGENSHPLTVVGKPDVSRLYNDFYRFLAESGIDGVKADAQVMIDMLKDAPDRRDLISTYLDVSSKTSEEYFGGKTISCMSQFPYSLFHSQLPRSRGEFSVRNSDDFFPDVPRSHPWHIWANAHNAIVTQFLNAVPDWDMFQTVHSYAEFHAAARCVIGSPIYITDIPGMHNMHLIKQMTATTPLGQTVVLRPSVLGKSMCAYAGYEDGLLLKIGSYNGASQTGTGILGIFNVSTRHLTEIIPLGLFPGVFEGGKYAVRSHTTGQTSAPMTTGAPDSVIAASINEAGYEILCAFPLAQFKSGRYGNGYAGAVGLVGKMTGCAAMTYSSVVQRDSGTVIVTCNLKALGTLGVYISTLRHLNIEDDFMVALEDQPVRFETVSRSEDDERIFEIDVERAWEEVAVSTMQRGEVQVKVSFQP
ncbi:raffinose synthase Sip1, partial [Metarhizium hybridum]